MPLESVPWVMNENIKTDENWIAALKNGDEAAFEKLYDNYSALMFGVIIKIVPNSSDAENLLQDCFVKIWRFIGSYDASKGRLSTWLINVARNTAIDFKRSKNYSQAQKNQNLDLLVGTPKETKTSHNVDTIGLQKLLDTLTPEARQVIYWMYFDGYTQQEISDEFNIPLGTVKTRTRSALKELRQFFDT